MEKAKLEQRKLTWSVAAPYILMIFLLGSLFIILFVAPSSTASSISFSSQADTVLSAKFNPQSQGWLGADVSVSIQLDATTYLWLWGDTVYGNIAKDSSGESYRNLSAFPHSSMAIVNMSGSQLPEFYFKKLPNSEAVDPMGLFRPQNPSDPSEFYWTVGGVISPTTKQLVVITQVIIDTNSGIGFSQIGTDVVLVSNPLSPLQQWTYTTSRITSSNANLSWNSGITFSNGYFYLVGLDNSNAYLARILEADLIKFNWEGMTYWSKGNTWANNVNSLLSLYPSTYTEGTLQYHSYMQEWYIVLSQAYQGSIYIAHAPAITGPYVVDNVYSVPKGYQNGTLFAYAAKSHPEFAGQNEIVFTYNVNADSLSLLFHDLDIYHPKFVRVAITLN